MNKDEEREIIRKAIIKKHLEKPWLSKDEIIDELFDEADWIVYLISFGVVSTIFIAFYWKEILNFINSIV